MFNIFSIPKFIKATILRVLGWYKKGLSPFLLWLPLIFPVACKFYPSCADYSTEAIQKHGLIKGLGLSLKRVLHCHPLNQGGLDLVP